MELSGGRSEAVLLGFPIPDRSSEERSWAQQFARGGGGPVGPRHLQSTHLHVEPDSQHRILLHRPPHGAARLLLSRDVCDDGISAGAAPAAGVAVAGARIGAPARADLHRRDTVYM